MVSMEWLCIGSDHTGRWIDTSTDVKVNLELSDNSLLRRAGCPSGFRASGVRVHCSLSMQSVDSTLRECPGLWRSLPCPVPMS